MGKIMILSGLQVHIHFMVKLRLNDTALMMGFFDRSNTKVRGVAANLGKREGNIRYQRIKTANELGWTGLFYPQSMGRDRFLYCAATNKEIGTKYLLTTKEQAEEDFYHFLMTNYKLPLLRWWIPYIMEQLYTERLVSNPTLDVITGDEYPVKISLGNREVNIADLTCYDFSTLTNEGLSLSISNMLKRKIIWITRKKMQPLTFETFDDYIRKYGTSLVDNLNSLIRPLIPLKPNVDSLALMEKSLYPQQAACVNGVLAMRRKGIPYAILNHGMGVGKTLQTMAAIEAAMIEEYLKKNPDKTLKDAYQPGVIKYRVCVMAPGHLVEKWKEELEKDIPYVQVTIVRSLAQLVSLREAGKKPKGKEYYIMSKDFAKLDTLLSPIPYQVKMAPFSLDICADCRDEDGKIYYKKGHGTNAQCPACKGNHFISYPISTQLYRGFICPNCGNLLIRNKGYDTGKDDFYETLDTNVLKPKNFASRKNENSTCYHCESALWGSNAKPLSELPNSYIRTPRWYKVSHYTNHAHKGRTSAFVLKGHEEEYKASVLTTADWQENPNVYGPRKVAPAKYIKKYLKGYFDFCVLDEFHKYLGQSAQGVAAHAFIKASRFTLALTGTISNGTAEGFYNLFWMLEPKRLLDMGYHYSSSEQMRFCKEYGCVEAVYELTKPSSGSYNVMSRGKQLTPPKVKPGISPVIFGKLLMDRCLFLDISDLSKYLPKLKEKVELVDLPHDFSWDYTRVIETLKEESQKGGGMALLSTMLQFGLSYPDKPYGREPILDPFRKDVLIIKPANHERYADATCLTPKEEKLIHIINKEIEEGRNCFVYATFTSSAESNVTYRLKELIEKYCNLKGRVEIIQSNSPAAAIREQWFHKKAADGVKVFITNPANVETGLDFCFKHEGVTYNYPTLIFYQTGYSLATIWQASRRAYRLNQKEECRNYYLAYSNTLQAAALEIMAKKQTATAAIQGHFTTEGLAAMAKGVDARAQLAAALSKNDMSSRDTLENMFDALSIKHDLPDGYEGFIPSPSFYEIMGYAQQTGTDVSFDEFLFDEGMFDMLLGADLLDASEEAFIPTVSESEEKAEIRDITPSVDEAADVFEDSFEDMVASFFDLNLSLSDASYENPKKPKKKQSQVGMIYGEISLFDIAEMKTMK